VALSESKMKSQGIELVEECIEPAPILNVDVEKLRTCFINVVANAIQAMPEGGTMRITFRRVEGSMVISFSDTGAGIEAGVADHVFEPFFTTKETGRGTGLGLSMVYGFVKQSGGHIKVYSEEGHGTTFKLYLPQTDDNVGAGIVYPMMTATGGTETILAVEDDALVRQYVVVRLQSLGYSVLAAASAREALDLVSAGVQFDLLFTDVIIGGDMNGRQLADAIAGQRPNVKVLYTSGYTENAIMHHGRLDPGVALIDKPYRMAELARKIREVLGTPGDPAASRAAV
jgi:CheY-like chemotaxis protein